MNRTQRVAALKQVIAHTIKGERELAEALFKEVTTASAREILGEGNYSLDDDPEFDGRREMQRELEDDLDSGKMEPGADEMGGEEGACPKCGSEECPGCEGEDGGLGVGGDADQTIEDIVSKLEAGDVDDEILSMILAMVSGEEGEGEPEGEPGLEDEPEELGGEGGEPGADAGGSPVGADGEIDLGALMKSESVGDAADLLKKIKFALEYDYDQFLDSGGEQAEWADVALGNPSPELSELLLQIPPKQKIAYDSMIEKIVHFQAGGSARLKDLL